MSSNSQQKHSSSKAVKKESNFKGKNIWSVWKNEFIVDERYQLIKGIGKGAYGVVCSAKDSKTQKDVAIKKIANAFENIIDAKRTLRELTLLRNLKHDNIVQIVDILQPLNPHQFEDVYIVYELMDTDLHQIIRSPQPLSDQHFQYFTYQILRGLKFVHSAQVLHRDLKPSNLLLTANCDLKICDFGLARQSDENNYMTEYVVTRWYRAPELLLSCDKYTEAIDVWAVGCILAELITRKPVFPGKDYIDQLRHILNHVGLPTEQEITFIGSTKAKTFIRNAIVQKEKSILRKAMSAEGVNPDAIDLLSKMLQFDPRKRISVLDALKHPYVGELHKEGKDDEPSADGPFDPGYEEDNLTEDDLRKLVLQEIQYYHPKH